MLNKKEGAWYYHPVAASASKNHQAVILFARLHEKSRYVFKIELYKDQSEHVSHAVNAFALHAKDPIFLGYPYGLIEAHKFAKVPVTERDYHKIQLMAQLGKEWKTVEQYMKAVDGHAVLDKI